MWCAGRIIFETLLLSVLFISTVAVCGVLGGRKGGMEGATAACGGRKGEIEAFLFDRT